MTYDLLTTLLSKFYNNKTLDFQIFKKENNQSKQSKLESYDAFKPFFEMSSSTASIQIPTSGFNSDGWMDEWKKFLKNLLALNKQKKKFYVSSIWW